MILMFIDASAGQKCKYKNYLYKHAVSHQKKQKNKTKKTCWVLSMGYVDGIDGLGN